MRDSQDSYRQLEKLFGILGKGMAFGESILLGSQEKNRFYNAITLTDCVIL